MYIYISIIHPSAYIITKQLSHSEPGPLPVLFSLSKSKGVIEGEATLSDSQVGL